MPATVADISDADLLERAVKGARAAHRSVRWVAVMRVFGLGSTYSQQLCERFGLNPEEIVKP